MKTNSDDYLHSATVHMFLEDFSNGIIPYGHRPSGTFVVKPRNEAFEKIMRDVLHSERYSRYGLQDSIIDFARKVSYSLVRYGIAIFRMISFGDELKLIYLENGRVRLKRNSVHYIMDNGTEEEYNIKECVVFDMPPEVGSYKKYNSFLRNLSFLNTEQVGSMGLLQMQGQLQHYDFTMHQMILEDESWKLTRYIGYHHRSYLGYHNRSFEFYRYSRCLRFKKTQLHVRNQIYRCLQEMFVKAANLTGVNCELEMQTVDPLKIIDHLENEWNNGRLSFKSLIRISLEL
ncbi:hypothetical protein F9K33_00370 [bacterium]|nr:MAG: hypothetical protein F9K33_00370 [bacterium]